MAGIGGNNVQRRWLHTVRDPGRERQEVGMSQVSNALSDLKKPKEGGVMTMIGLLEQAKEHMACVTGLKPVAVTRASRDDQGWHVGVEMLEMSRIPTATDMLGEYEVLLTEDGTLVRFSRKRTRLRGEPREEEER